MFPRWTVLMISACWSLTSCSPKPSELADTAKQAIAKGDYRSALLPLKSGLADHPGNPDLRFLLGQALLRGGDAAAATIELKKARELGHAASAVVPELARAMLAQSKFQAVVDEFANLRLDGADANAEIKSALAFAYANLGRDQAMAQAVDEAVAASPKLPSVLLARARLLVGRGDADGALKLVDEVDASAQLQVEAKLLRADILLRARHDAVGAVVALREALAVDSMSLASHVRIIGIEMSQGHADLAKRQLKDLKQLMPMHPQVLYVEAQIAYNDKDYGHALETLELLLRAYPDMAKIRLFAGAVQYQRNALLQSETLLLKALQLDPSLVLARQYLAQTYLRMGQPAKALAVLGDLAESGNPSAESVALAAQAQMLSGNLVRAEAMFNQAAKLKPGDPTLRTALALTDLAKGRDGSAFEALESIASRDSGASADMALISARMRRREWPAALKAVDRLQTKQPGKPLAGYLRGLVLRQQGDPLSARASFEQAVKLDPGYFSAILALAEMDLAELKPDAARHKLEEAIALNPKNTAARMAVVEILKQQSVKPEEIRKALAAAVLADGTAPAPRLALVAHLSDANDLKGALAAAQSAIAALPDNVDVLEVLGRAQANVGDSQQASSSFKKLANLRPGSALPYLRLADLQAAGQDHSALMYSLKRAFDLAPGSPDVHSRLVAASVKTKDLKLALDSAHELQRRQPGSASGFLLEGDVYLAHRRFGPALAAYRLGLDKADSSRKAAPMVYQTLRASDQLPEADRFAADWIKRHPKDTLFLSYLGDDALLRKDEALAERRFREVLAIDPRRVNALNNVAWLMARRGAQGAVALAEKALALAPNQALLLDTLAEALAAEGQVVRAIEVGQRLLVLQPEKPGHRLRLARFFLRNQQKDKALVELDLLDALGAGYEGQSEVSRLRQSALP